MPRIKQTSPALVVSIIALTAAVVVPAFAKVATSALSKKEKRVVRKIGRAQANRQITRRAPKLSVARANSANSANTANSAETAGNAELLDGMNATAFAPAGEIHTPGRFVVNDPTPGDISAYSEELLAVPPFSFRGRCYEDYNGGATDIGGLAIEAPSNSSFAGFRSKSFVDFPDSGELGVAEVESTGNEVRASHIIVVAPSGEVISVTASVEVGDPAGDCVFGVTVIGP